MDAISNALITQHKLDFLSAPWHRDPSWFLFKVGTCAGQWRATELFYEVLSIKNNKPGNGHLEDVFEWFEFSCKRDKKDLKVLEVMNVDFGKHLVNKRGFKHYMGCDYIKHFNHEN